MVGIGEDPSMTSFWVEDRMTGVGFNIIQLPCPSRLSVPSGFLAHWIGVKGVSPPLHTAGCVLACRLG